MVFKSTWVPSVISMNGILRSLKPGYEWDATLVYVIYT